MFMSCQCRGFYVDTLDAVHARNPYVDRKRRSISIGRRFKDHPCQSFLLLWLDPLIRLITTTTPFLGIYFHI